MPQLGVLGLIILGHYLDTSAPLIRWPRGTYGIPKPDTGCPRADGFQWLEGWRSQDTNGVNSNNSKSANFHLDGTVNKTKVCRSFCIKTNTTHDSARIDWPQGQYCIYKSGRCPRAAGVPMIHGHVYWDDENKNNENAKGGELPGGTFEKNTLIRFCCATNGTDKNEPVILPTAHPFFLLAYGSAKCQMVKWAIATLEWIHYDTENNDNKDQVGGKAYPYNAGKKHPTIYYCHYRDCNETLTGIQGTFHSPNYPGHYPNGQHCSWNISVGSTHQIHLTFTDFNLQSENNTDGLYVYDGDSPSVEMLHGVYYGDYTPPQEGIFSSSNHMFIIFKSDKNASDTGFSASYCEDKCVEPTTVPKATQTPKTSLPTVSSETTEKATTTDKERTSTKDGEKRGKREQPKGVNVVAVAVPLVVTFVVLLALAGFIYYKRKTNKNQTKETPNVIYASAQMTSDNPCYDRRAGEPPPSVGNPCYDRGFPIANSGCSEAHEMYTSLNPNTMDRRDAYSQPDRQFHGVPVYVTLEPSQTMENPMYDSTT